jgi:hypothetical protein
MAVSRSLNGYYHSLNNVVSIDIKKRKKRAIERKKIKLVVNKIKSLILFSFIIGGSLVAVIDYIFVGF